jgi:hypothetical protein
MRLDDKHRTRTGMLPGVLYTNKPMLAGPMSGRSWPPGKQLHQGSNCTREASSPASQLTYLAFDAQPSLEPCHCAEAHLREQSCPNPKLGAVLLGSLLRLKSMPIGHVSAQHVNGHSQVLTGTEGCAGQQERCRTCTTTPCSASSPPPRRC